MTDPAPRIHVVEDDEAVRDSILALLDSWGFEVAGYPDAETFLQAQGGAQADCLLLDARLPGQDGLELLRSLRADGIDTPVIVVTGHGDVALAVQALRDGAQDFVEKPYDDEDLVQRIEAAIRSRQPREPDRAALGRLTPREVEVLREVISGHSNKVIAHHLGLSPKTVEVHRARVMEKTGAGNLPQLVRIAISAGLDPDA